MWPFFRFPAESVTLKRLQREHALESAAPYDSATHDGYLHAHAGEIVARIQSGEWTAAQVLEAYIARAVVAQHRTNCLTEIMFEPARERAAALDREFVMTKKLVGPLHGVPISIKDTFEIAGFDTTVGFTCWIGQPATTNAEAVQLLIAAGAVPFVKTNIPQALMAFECANPLWGRTTNPYSTAHSSGGSSGGEAALLALNGSAMGLGTDLAGSLRFPAGHCGIYALKPGRGRIPVGGAKSSYGGNEGLPLVAGPMGRSVDDLVIACQVLFGAFDQARDVAPLPYREVKLPNKLTFGYFTDDGFVKACPAVARAVEETTQALRQQGHECFELDWPYASEPVQIFNGMYSSDGYRTLLSKIGSDPLDPSLQSISIIPSLPGWLRSFVAWMIITFIGDVQFATLLRECARKSVFDLYRFQERRNHFTRRVYSEIWDKHRLDGIIAPVQVLPAFPHKSSRDTNSLGNSGMMFSVVDSPAGVVPVTRVDAAKDALPEGYWALSPGKMGSQILNRACEGLYDPVKMAGLPVGVQVVGKKWEDEKVLAMMRVVDEALRQRDPEP